MYVSLWERYLDTLIVEGVIDTFQDIADDVRLLGCLCPDEQFEIDAGIPHYS